MFKEQFKKDLLQKCQSVAKGDSNEEEGLTLQGFKDYFIDEYSSLSKKPTA